MLLLRCSEPAFVSTIKKLTQKNLARFQCRNIECEAIDRLQEYLNDKRNFKRLQSISDQDSIEIDRK